MGHDRIQQKNWDECCSMSRKSALKWRGGEEEGGERGGERERDKRKNFEGADPKLAHV